MKNLINKLKGAVELKLIQSTFRTIFEPVDTTHPELAADLVAFCTDGEPAGCLLKVQQHAFTGLSEKFGPIASTRWYVGAQPNASAEARYKLYDLAANGKLELTYLVRLGKALEALLKPEIYKHTPADFPDWLHILLTDFCREKSPRNLPNGSRAENDVAKRNIAFYEALCETGAVNKATWLFYYFDRNGVGSYWGYISPLKVFSNVEGFTDYIVEQKDYLTQTLFPALSVEGKVQFIRKLSQRHIANEYSEFLIDQGVSSSKKVSNEAASIITPFPRDVIKKHLPEYLKNGTSAERKQAASLISRLLEEEGTPYLLAALETETSMSVQSAIRMALGSSEAAAVSETAPELSIPEYTKPEMSTDVSPAVVEQIYEKIKKIQEKFAEITPEYPYQKDQKKRAMALGKSDAADVVKAMNGTVVKDWYSIATFMNDAQLFSDPSIQLIHVTRLLGNPTAGGNRRLHHLSYGPLPLFLKKQPDKVEDLRQMRDVLSASGWPPDTIDREILYSHWSKSFLLTDISAPGVWPYFAKKIDILNAVLMGQGQNAGSREHPSLDRVFDVLECFEQLPNGVIASLLHIALGEGKTYRERAQKLLSPVAEIEQSVATALNSTAQEARINAARWLANIGSSGSIKPLKEALAKEKREAPRATIISALEALGEDISGLLSPKLLLKEAEKGLSKQIPRSLEWFPFAGLPKLKWSDGKDVDPQIPKWWIVLACKLKDPGGNELVLKYLERLDLPSRQTLGMYILQAFIAQDTRHPTVEEAEAKARQDAPGLYQAWQKWAKSDWGKEYAKYTLDDAHTTIKNGVLATYLGSAIKDKGILALCAYSSGSDAASVVRRFMKDHYTRRAQIESMLKALVPGNDSHVIQLLLSVSRRYRTRSVQELARTLVEEVAGRNDWTQDELADRTLPSAGFDQDGKMQLEYGSRNFTVTLDTELKPVLTNEEGNTIKALPAPRQSDDEALVKEAKSQLSASKKELKQVVALTTGRFYEAMCAGREWPASDWVTYLYEHPIANRLSQRLIWILKAGDQITYFRPTEDGALIDVEDDELTLPRQGSISLAHCSSMSPAMIESWSSHIKDYSVKPLFEQINRPLLNGVPNLELTKLNQYEGYVSDAFTFRGIFNKLGYQRGEAEDGGFFYYYYKDFNSLGLRATILFSGNCLPEENVAAALQELCFSKLGRNSWFNENDLVPVKDVPPILLSEIMADYKTIADKTGGFDPDWQKKMPW